MKRLVVIACAVFLVAGVNAVAKAGLALSDLTELSLEELMNIAITSVSKRPQRLFEAAAAVHVITNADIRRSGVRSIPEALRLAPGINVAQIDANKWAVAARGFNDRFTDKLLVLIDGRSVYSPSTSGVFWDMQNYLLEDIDRIEVIRGPGGTLWGANAVNGVINIITKNAEDTQGGYLTVGAGSHERAFGGIRYGRPIGENGFVRAYVDGFSRDDLDNGFDAWHRGQGGFRADWDMAEAHFTLQGDYFRGENRQRQVVPSITPPNFPVVNETYDVSGANLLARYNRRPDEHTDLQVQFYYDRTERDELVFAGTRDTLDLEFQHRLQPLSDHDFVYGAGVRYYRDEFFNDNPAFVRWDPAESNHLLFSGFVQDEISFWDDQLRLTLGTKLEYNDYTQWEFQPNVRFAWLPAPGHVVWGAVSRAVQVPERNANDITILLPVPPVPPGLAPLPTFFTGKGSKSVDSQELVAYEIGYRVQPSDSVSVDVAAFYNEYDNFITGAPGTATLGTPPTHLLFSTVTTNGGEGNSYGFEASVEWRPMETWRLVGTYSYLRIRLGNFLNSLFAEGKDPRHQVSLRSSMDLPGNVELDLWGRFVDDLPSFARENVEDYFDLDVRVSWKPTDNIEASIVGQNLLDSRRFEFGAGQFDRTLPSAVERSVYLQFSYKF